MQIAAKKTRAIGMPTSTPSLLWSECLVLATAEEVAEEEVEGVGIVIKDMIGPELSLNPSRSTTRRLSVRLFRD